MTTKEHLFDAIGPMVNRLDLTIWHTTPDGIKLFQLGIHVCRKETRMVEYVYRNVKMSQERRELLLAGDEDAIARVNTACEQAKKEIHQTLIEGFGSLDNIDLVATAEGSEVQH